MEKIPVSGKIGVLGGGKIGYNQGKAGNCQKRMIGWYVAK